MGWASRAKANRPEYRAEQVEARSAAGARRIDINSDHPASTKNGSPGSLQVQADGTIYEVQRDGMLRRLKGKPLELAKAIVVKTLVDRVKKKVGSVGAQKIGGDREGE